MTTIFLGRLRLSVVFASVVCLILGVTLAATVVSAEPKTDVIQVAKVEGSYQLQNVQFGNLLRPRGASNKDGTPIVLYPHQDWKCLTWQFEPAEEGGYRLLNHFTHKTFIPDTSTDTLQVPLVQSPPEKKPSPVESWRLVRLEDDTFKIMHIPTGKMMMAIDNGRRVVLADDDNTDSQKWKLLPRPKKFAA